MPFKPGETGNRHGRPPKGQTLVDALVKEFVKENPSSGLSPKDVLAQYMAQACVEGGVDMPDGSRIILSPEAWLDCVKWSYLRIDGAPKQELDIANTTFMFDPQLTVVDMPQIEKNVPIAEEMFEAETD